MSTTAEERRAAILNAIDDEPEYPGVMPDEMWYGLRNDRDATAEAMRVSVRLTKQNIRKRVAALLEGEGGEPRHAGIPGIAWRNLGTERIGFYPDDMAGLQPRELRGVRAVLYFEPARVPSESEGDVGLLELLRRAWEFPDEPMPADGEVSDSDIMRGRDEWLGRWRALDAEVRSRLASVTEGSVDRGSVNVRAPESASVNATSPSAGPEVLPHVPDTAGEADVMPGRVRT